MSERLSDAEMMIVTQIAYMDTGQCKNRTIGEIIEHKEKYYSTLKEAGALSKRDEKQYEYLDSLKKKIQDYHKENCYQWKIVDVCDKNDTTGFYGCLIDDGNGNAIMGFRGSESYDFKQLFKDWAVADFGLLNNKGLTDQQKNASDYTKYVYDKYGDQYESFSFSGHSLGGNLAEHAAVTAPDAMRSKISRAASFDGPGFSDEYNRKHAKEISKSTGYVDHYSWSWVSTLLPPLSGIPRQLVAAHDHEGKGPFVGKLYKHDTVNVEFNEEDGSLKNGHTDPVMNTAGPLSYVLEMGGPQAYTAISMIAENLNLDIIGQVASVFKRGVNTIVSAWMKYQEIRKYSQVNGEFEADSKNLLRLNESMEHAGRELSEISEQIREITRSLKYYSAAGAAYKLNLNILANQVSHSGRSAVQCSTAVKAAAALYDAGDEKVAWMFPNM